MKSSPSKTKCIVSLSLLTISRCAAVAIQKRHDHYNFMYVFRSNNNIIVHPLRNFHSIYFQDNFLYYVCDIITITVM